MWENHPAELQKLIGRCKIKLHLRLADTCWVVGFHERSLTNLITLLLRHIAERAGNVVSIDYFCLAFGPDKDAATDTALGQTKIRCGQHIGSLMKYEKAGEITFAQDHFIILYPRRLLPYIVSPSELIFMLANVLAHELGHAVDFAVKSAAKSEKLSQSSDDTGLRCYEAADESDCSHETTALTSNIELAVCLWRTFRLGPCKSPKHNTKALS